LGLSVVFGIIKDHGGEIRAESERGKFCRFIIELPYRENFDIRSEA
jgi:signal transduction histidine kinase